MNRIPTREVAYPLTDRKHAWQEEDFLAVTYDERAADPRVPQVGGGGEQARRLLGKPVVNLFRFDAKQRRPLLVKGRPCVFVHGHRWRLGRIAQGGHRYVDDRLQIAVALDGEVEMFLKDPQMIYVPKPPESCCVIL